jgi:hypothetical protein
MDSEKGVPSPYGDTYPTDHHAIQTVNKKTEQLSDTEVEEDPVSMTFVKNEAEPEVSLISLFAHC